MAASKKAKSKTGSPSRSKAKPRPAAKAKPRPNAKAKNAKKSRGGSGKAKAAPSKPQAVLNAVEETAKDAGGAVGNAAGKVGHVAGKAKVPLMAGGAALAGAVGGLALGARNTHRHNGIAGVSSKDLTKAAKKAGGAGLRVGELALEGRRAREARNGNGKVHRSPIEVVLEGLTSRK
jgi:hypothetical protein